MRDAAQLGRRLYRHVLGHELNEAHPCSKILLPVFEDGASQEGEARPAGVAVEPLAPAGRDITKRRDGRAPGQIYDWRDNHIRESSKALQQSRHRNPHDSGLLEYFIVMH